MESGSDYEIVVIAYKSRAPLTGFLEHLGQGVPIIVVDNSVDIDNLEDLAERFDGVRHIDAGGNLGFSAGANLGAGHSTAEILIFMNPDTLPSVSELERMVAVFEDSPDLASCGATGINTAGGGALPTFRRVLAHVLGLHRFLPMAGLYFYPRNGERVNAEWISGSCLAIRRTDFELVGGFDDSYFVFMSDFDLGRRLTMAGRSQIVLGDVTIPHFDGGSSDLPSEWTWDQRGKGWAQYLRRTMPTWRGLVLAGLLVGGFLGRAVAYSLAGRTLKAQEVRAYARSLSAEWRNLGAGSS